MHIDYTNGYYDGEVNGNEDPHGYGIMVWNNGNRYEGEWKDDNRHGRGKYYFSDGGRYEGEWRDGNKHGNGKYYYPDGNRYEGEWKDDKMHGKGKFIFADGGYYQGEMKNGDFNGYGVMQYSDGNKYAGEWRDDNRHGNGIYYYANGDRYEGQWKDDNKHGKGKYIFADGGYYQGEMKNGDFNGYGVMQCSDGELYKGEWKDDKRNGFGYSKYSNKTYEGYWKNDVWCGKGKVIQDDGIEIEGNWLSFGNATNVIMWQNGETFKGKLTDWNFEEAEESKKASYANLGGTAEFIPADYCTEKALEEVKNNPFTSDARIVNLEMRDSRWQADDGWVKVERVVEIRRFVTSEIDSSGEQLYQIKVHYVANRNTYQVDDFKIKEVLLNGKRISN